MPRPDTRTAPNEEESVPCLRDPNQQVVSFEDLTPEEAEELLALIDDAYAEP